MNLAVRRNSLKSEIQWGQQKNYASCLCVTEFKCRPTFYNFQETQGSKVTIRSEEDKMLPMDLSPRRNDDVDAYVRSFEPNQVQLVGHRTMGLSSQVWEVDHPTMRVGSIQWRFWRWRFWTDNCFDKDAGLPVAPVMLLDHSRKHNTARRVDSSRDRFRGSGLYRPGTR